MNTVGHPYVGVRVGATPEPRWVQVMRAEVAETKHFKVGSVTHLYEMAVAFYDEFARAALRAPEPLTAEPTKQTLLAMWDAYWPRHSGDNAESMRAVYEIAARAALEGGVSPQPSSSVHQTESAGKAVQRPVDDDLWRVLLGVAGTHFNRDPDWSEFDFLSRSLAGHATRKVRS